jgi:protein-disulfide isomerase
VPTNQPRPTKDQRREEARLKAAELRKQQERAAKRNRIIVISVAAVAVLGLVAVIVLTFQNAAANRKATENVAYPSAAPTMSAVALPSSADPETGGVPVSANGVGVAGSEGVTVDVYFDAMCSSCGIFEQVNRDDITALEQEEGVTIVYRPVAILDYLSQGTLYSTRAANAIAVVADQDPTNMPAFVAALYDKDTQPAESTTGLTDAKIAEVAQSVGVPATVTDKFTEGTPETGRTFAGWIAANTALLPVNSSGNAGTPSIVINGTQWEGNFAQAGAFKEAVEAAKG